MNYIQYENSINRIKIHFWPYMIRYMIYNTLFYSWTKSKDFTKFKYALWALTSYTSPVLASQLDLARYATNLRLVQKKSGAYYFVSKMVAHRARPDHNTQLLKNCILYFKELWVTFLGSKVATHPIFQFWIALNDPGYLVHSSYTQAKRLIIWRW